MPSPLIPKLPLSWEGIPLFHVGVFPKTFSGMLFFVMGQGLGDHINGFRVIDEVKNAFPKATLVVYADLRWEELVRRIGGIQIRWFPKAMDVLSKKGTNNPYESAIHEITQEVSVSPGNVYLAYAHFPMPDRHARQETTLEATARSIGLSLGDTPRPYLPIHSSDRTWTEEFLTLHGLENKKFAAIAPFTWPDKLWSKKNFSDLIDELYEKYGIRSVILSYPEIGPFLNKGAVCAFDLSLGQMAGLLSAARVYVGLDSGPSHMAAALDLPMVVVFVNKKVIPFEVRPLSPRALLVVESLFNSMAEPTLKTVIDSTAFLLHEEQRASPPMPECPVCNRLMCYVVTSTDHCLRLMCVCGLAIDRSVSESPTEKKESSQEEWATPPSLPFTLANEIETLEDFHQWSHFLNEGQLTYLEWTLRSNNHELERSLAPGQLIFGLDSLVMWMRENGFEFCGYRIDDNVNNRMIHESEEILSFERRPQHDIEDGPVVPIPWKGAPLLVNQEQYFRWFSFNRWADPETLVGIVKSQTELGFPRKERLRNALVAFRYQKGVRSFRWIFKTLYQ